MVEPLAGRLLFIVDLAPDSGEDGDVSMTTGSAAPTGSTTTVPKSTTTTKIETATRSSGAKVVALTFDDGPSKNGFEVENHTWDHPTLTKLSEAGVKSEISRTTKQLGGAHYVRPPYGTYNSVVMAVVRSLGLRLVRWNVDTLDWNYRGVSSILHYVEVEVRPGSDHPHA